MELSNKILSDITVFGKYAKFMPELGRRESWQELVDRNKEMHIRRYPEIEQEIEEAYIYVYSKKVLPSMRSLQFSGRPIELAHNRIYNCGNLPIESVDAFSELMFLLLGGTGLGYSVQRRHTFKLPVVLGPQEESRRFLVGDSIEGWADSIKVLVESYFLGKQLPRFDLRDIRPKGSPLKTTGGSAPGPAPLATCLNALEEKLLSCVGRRVEPIEAHDMCCIIADAVLAGGIRRAALICLFDRDDKAMLESKSGEWWIDAPYRARANNSVVLPRGVVGKEAFYALMKVVKESGAGEPGIYWSNNLDWGTNPCCEIGLRAYQFCNLCEINADDIVSQEDLNNRAKAASFIGTLQAGYTDFHYLRPIWKQTTEADALIGVGITGIGSGAILPFDLREAATYVNEENERVAGLIGINPAARTTTVKPSGTSSLVCGSSSGVHAWHNDYYIRRMRLGKEEALYSYFAENIPALVEDDVFVKGGAVASFPQKAPEGSIFRTESPESLLERVRNFNVDWVGHGHLDGDNTNNVSCTISVKDDEWGMVTDWMWNNRNDYNGISVLPYNGGTYVQAPFEDCTKEVYDEMVKHLKDVDLSKVKEQRDNTDLAGEVACAGGVCELVM